MSIVERLLQDRVAYWDRDQANGLLKEAADEIERLRAALRSCRRELKFADPSLVDMIDRALEREE